MDKVAEIDDWARQVRLSWMRLLNVGVVHKRVMVGIIGCVDLHLARDSENTGQHGKPDEVDDGRCDQRSK